MTESFIAEVQDLNRITIPKEVAEILKVKKGIKIRCVIEKVYR